MFCFEGTLFVGLKGNHGENRSHLSGSPKRDTPKREKQSKGQVSPNPEREPAASGLNSYVHLDTSSVANDNHS